MEDGNEISSPAGERGPSPPAASDAPEPTPTVDAEVQSTNAILLETVSVVEDGDIGEELPSVAPVEVAVVDTGEEDSRIDGVVGHDNYEVNDDARSLGDLDSLPAGDELALGTAGSDSGVEGCGRALSSGGGSRSCASSVVSCGSGCGSESSSLAGGPPRPRRRFNVTVAEPNKPRTPLGASTPRPVTAPRGPNLATRERARSREKPTPPEKPRPLTPKPRIRPTADLPNVVRESPALRAKPTKTSTARCRTPNSPTEDKRLLGSVPRLGALIDASAARITADKYGTLPRRRRDNDPEGSPKHEGTPPSVRRATVTRSASSRTVTKTRVKIYAEKTQQTVLIGTDLEEAFAGRLPNIESRSEVSVSHRGVQASWRDVELARAVERAAAAEAALAEERVRRDRAEHQLAEEQAARLAAHHELERNSLRLLELAGAGADAGTEGCLRTLEEQLRASAELAARQRVDIDRLRDQCAALQMTLHVTLNQEASRARENVRSLEARLAEAEREAAEMQDFLAAETGALGDSLRDAEAELVHAKTELERRRGECRQLVRMCEQRRQEALAALARARSTGGAAHALDSLAHRLKTLTDAVARAYRLPRDKIEPRVYHNAAYSRSDSGEALSPEEEAARGGLLGAVARALRGAADRADDHDDRSRISDDNSADLLDSETEPCLVTDPVDPEYADDWWSGAEGAGAWSGEELSPVRDEPDAEPESTSVSERESLRNLSAAIVHRQRSEAEDAERGSLLDRVLVIDNRLTDLLRALRLAAAAAAHTDDADSMRLASALRDKIDATERNVADVVVKKLAELDASKNMIDQYRQSIEALKRQLAQVGEIDDLDVLETELISCAENERRERYEAVDAALMAFSSRQGAVSAWPRLAALQARLERLAFAVATHRPAPAHTTALPAPHPLHTAA
ncbi:hypothetical protein EVAR_7773_1 [Eumeta japonica]|uniref:Uncharacterized protein n=1 Tax=Eumeta variegata TaxID=151549 RepID=A0A4C1TKB0_EUMVA|nr:hypothetical protein EVAR_7773_1 [Eumeta japonica]